MYKRGYPFGVLDLLIRALKGLFTMAYKRYFLLFVYPKGGVGSLKTSLKLSQFLIQKYVHSVMLNRPDFG
jgi:hypothetical protein